MKKAKKIFNQKRVRIIALIVLDIIALALCSFLALALRFDFHDITQKYIDNLFNYIIIDVIIMVTIFSFFKVYKSMWTYASITELINIMIACTIYEII